MDQARISECERAIGYLDERIHEMETAMKRGRFLHLCEDANGHLKADDTPRMLRVTKAEKKTQQGRLALLRSYAA